MLSFPRLLHLFGPNSTAYSRSMRKTTQPERVYAATRCCPIPASTPYRASYISTSIAVFLSERKARAPVFSPAWEIVSSPARKKV